MAAVLSHFFRHKVQLFDSWVQLDVAFFGKILLFLFSEQTTQVRRGSISSSKSSMRSCIADSSGLSCSGRYPRVSLAFRRVLKRLWAMSSSWDSCDAETILSCLRCEVMVCWSSWIMVFIRDIDCPGAYPGYVQPWVPESSMSLACLGGVLLCFLHISSVWWVDLFTCFDVRRIGSLPFLIKWVPDFNHFEP